ncbi:amidase [Mycobacterium vicinigordonae]|uniref:amidase n=1 Tax=Mycobacterium vicinigordonae TaxID=1719132 RepID=UPI001BB4388A|nr:amidase [Mycobacterium vicinigordonae]
MTLSATELARRIRTGAATSREVVETHIAHIEQVNPTLNAVVCERFSEARQEADAADERVHTEDPDSLPPFHGVPCTIKENIALTGMPNTCGVVARKTVIADRDAPSVARLRAAGAIPLGVTNIAEWTAWTATDNRIYGRTNNAYHPARTAGGSSGGEGAAVGSGASPFGLGTDIGGSIRIPAFCNGVFGHKPTGGLVPSSGQFPNCQGAQARINTTGPLARRAEDLMPLLRVIAGPHPTDPQSRHFELGDPSAVDVKDLRILVIDTDGNRPKVSNELRTAASRAAAVLRALGARVEHPTISGLSKAVFGYFGRLLQDGQWPFALETGPRTLRWASPLKEHILPVAAVNILTPPLLRFPAAIHRLTMTAQSLEAEIDSALGDDGVLFYPSATGVAPAHGRGGALHFRFALLFNALEMPATQVPLGLGTAGLPLGLQVVAGRGQDHRTIAVALALEKAFGGWTPPKY